MACPYILFSFELFRYSSRCHVVDRAVIATGDDPRAVRADKARPGHLLDMNAPQRSAGCLLTARFWSSMVVNGCLAADLAKLYQRAMKTVGETEGTAWHALIFCLALSYSGTAPGVM